MCVGVVLATAGRAAQAEDVCPGDFQVPGHGLVSIVPTGWGLPNAALVEVTGSGRVTTSMDARAYFASACTNGVYSNEQYLAMKLLGKEFRYTSDLSGAGCGCNAALYLTSMRQNPRPSTCRDYYCDANNICGESCAEIDIQEANQRAWHSTLHTGTDRFGVMGGYGGGDGFNGARDWGAGDYGPGGRCIDTSKPFDVAARFQTTAEGSLDAMLVQLSQPGRSCTLSTKLGSYAGMAELSAALEAGMTPVVSYWSSNKMLWLDGRGSDQRGPCAIDNKVACAAAVSFYNFSVVPISAPPTPPAMEPAPAPGSSQLRPTRAPAGLPALPPLLAPVPAPVPVPIPVAARPAHGEDGKIAISDALGAFCGRSTQLPEVKGTLMGNLITSTERLHKSPHQWCVCTAALILGAVSAWDGPFFYKTIFTVVSVMVAASIADYETRALELTADLVSQSVVVVQVSIAVATAIYHGFGGFQVLFGAALGLLGTQGSCRWALSADHVVHGFALFLYSMGALLGCLIFTVWRHLFLKMLGPLVGGFLVATGFGGLFSRIHEALTSTHLPIFPPPDLDWEASAADTLGTHGRGAIAGACGCALLALVCMGFGGERKRALAVSALMGYILVNAVVAVTMPRSLGTNDSWPWPMFGCLLWALITSASAWRQLDDVIQSEVQESVSQAMTTMSSMASMPAKFPWRSSIYRPPSWPGAADRDERLIVEPSAPPMSEWSRERHASRERHVALERLSSRERQPTQRLQGRQPPASPPSGTAELPDGGRPRRQQR